MIILENNFNNRKFKIRFLNLNLKNVYVPLGHGLA